MSTIHISTGNGQSCQYDESQVAFLLQQGLLRSDMLFWKEGMTNWQPLYTAFPNLSPQGGTFYNTVKASNTKAPKTNNLKWFLILIPVALIVLFVVAFVSYKQIYKKALTSAAVAVRTASTQTQDKEKENQAKKIVEDANIKDSLTVENATRNQKVATSVKATFAQVGKAFTIPELNLKMCAIPAENFNDETQNNVKISNSFWLGETEVTQGQWTAVMGTTLKQQFYRGVFWGSEEFLYSNAGKNRPMFWVNYEEVLVFCNRLTERERTAGRLPEGYKYTLPTEAQWTYACDAGKYATFGERREMGWFNDNSDKATHDVAMKKSNAWGLYDMYGNVWELCLDSSGDFITNDKRLIPKLILVGGCWRFSVYDSVPIGMMSKNVKLSRYNCVGFRVTCVQAE